MAITNYTYVKLKMPGPCGVITIGGDLQQAHLCERENYNITTAACQPLRQTMTQHKDGMIEGH
jgi:hypothetical protein